MRKVIRTLTKPVVEPPKPAPTKSKRGRTLRPKIVLQPDDEDDDRRTQSGPRVFEAWYPEVGSYCMTCFDSYLSFNINIKASAKEKIQFLTASCNRKPKFSLLQRFTFLVTSVKVAFLWFSFKFRNIFSLNNSVCHVLGVISYF